MKKDDLFPRAWRIKEVDLELDWQRAVELGLAEASWGGLVSEALLGKHWKFGSSEHRFESKDVAYLLAGPDLKFKG